MRGRRGASSDCRRDGTAGGRGRASEDAARAPDSRGATPLSVGVLSLSVSGDSPERRSVRPGASARLRRHARRAGAPSPDQADAHGRAPRELDGRARRAACRGGRVWSVSTGPGRRVSFRPGARAAPPTPLADCVGGASVGRQGGARARSWTDLLFANRGLGCSVAQPVHSERFWGGGPRERGASSHHHLLVNLFCCCCFPTHAFRAAAARFQRPTPATSTRSWTHPIARSRRTARTYERDGPICSALLTRRPSRDEKHPSAIAAGAPSPK